jgi:hypothetical protein
MHAGTSSSVGPLTNQTVRSDTGSLRLSCSTDINGTVNAIKIFTVFSIMLELSFLTIFCLLLEQRKREFRG